MTNTIAASNYIGILIEVPNLHQLKSPLLDPILHSKNYCKMCTWAIMYFDAAVVFLMQFST